MFLVVTCYQLIHFVSFPYCPNIGHIGTTIVNQVWRKMLLTLTIVMVALLDAMCKKHTLARQSILSLPIYQIVYCLHYLSYTGRHRWLQFVHRYLSGPTLPLCHQHL